MITLMPHFRDEIDRLMGKTKGGDLCVFIYRIQCGVFAIIAILGETQKDRQTGRQADRQTGRQADRQVAGCEESPRVKGLQSGACLHLRGSAAARRCLPVQ
jgi:hypothetical protein